MNKLLLIALFLVFLIIGLLIGSINLQLVELNLYWFSLSMPLALFIAILLLLGILISWLSMTLKLFRLKRENSRLQKNLEKAIASESTEH